MDAVSQEWKHAERILERSNTIIFFGFAFNQYDLEILNLFKRTSYGIKKIILINRSPQTIPLAKQIWPSAEIMFINSAAIERSIEKTT